MPSPLSQQLSPWSRSSGLELFPVPKTTTLTLSCVHLSEKAAISTWTLLLDSSPAPAQPTPTIFRRDPLLPPRTCASLWLTTPSDLARFYTEVDYSGIEYQAYGNYQACQNLPDTVRTKIHLLLVLYCLGSWRFPEICVQILLLSKC